ncbi:hypothetical protein AMS68_005022 [Peltaster fructicola]|uniref:F-box domain-containing protein n=1 Tax=Peltaster fructicola TaxID=286661 RepID=A0A6H0XXW7_9PEZI|nr:hypothetical protein AMS68_005022 [Peltaster fructicola]
MHRAWDVDDIWHMICEYLDRRDLKALALTCAHLGECASDALWADVTSPAAFTCRLPSDWRERPLTLQDVARLDQRFARIRTITFRSKTIPAGFKHTKELASANKKKNWSTLWSEVAALRPQSQAFPALRTVDVHNTHRDVLIPLVGLSATQLRTLRLRGLHGKKRRAVTQDFVQNAEELAQPPARDADTHLRLLGKHVQSPLDSIQLRPRLHAPEVERAKAYLATSQPILSPQLNTMSELSPFKYKLRHAWKMLLDQLDHASSLDVLTAYYLTIKAARFVLAGTDQSQDFGASFSRLSLEFKKTPVPDGMDAAGALAAAIQMVVEANPRRKHKRLTDLIMSLQRWSDMFTAPAGESLNGQSFLDSLSITLPNLRSLELSRVPHFLERYDPDIYRAYAEQMPSLENLQLGSQWDPFHPWCYSEKAFKKDNMVPIRHLAAFLSLLPGLESIGLPMVINDAFLDSDPSPAFAARAVKAVSLHCLTARPEVYKSALANLEADLSTYFPIARPSRETIEVWFIEDREPLWQLRPRSYIKHHLRSSTQQ